jgi:hypothetical protein
MEIEDYSGNTRYLSNELYEILVPNMASTGDGKYDKGSYVRLISGVENSPIIGYHRLNDWVTVCSIYAEIAEFIGIKKIHIEKK